MIGLFVDAEVIFFFVPKYASLIKKFLFLVIYKLQNLS